MTRDKWMEAAQGLEIERDGLRRRLIEVSDGYANAMERPGGGDPRHPLAPTALERAEWAGKGSDDAP